MPAAQLLSFLGHRLSAECTSRIDPFLRFSLGLCVPVPSFDSRDSLESVSFLSLVGFRDVLRRAVRGATLRLRLDSFFAGGSFNGNIRNGLIY